MSGIGAIFHRDARPVEREPLERMSRSLAMYGTEKQRVMTDGEIGFVYTHFSNTSEARLDTQPLLSEKTGSAFVFDGRIDNRADLAAAVSIGPGQLVRMSDAALAFAAWQRFGEDGLNRWVGEFAAIIWNRPAREVTMLRDQFGRRPLHYNLTDDRLVTASLPKGIHALGDIPRELDRERLTYVLAQVDAHPTRSFFRGIECIAPASVKTVSPKKERSRRYYSLRDHAQPIRYSRDQEYADHAQHLIETAVGACLRSPGPVGALLSAGMDSTLSASIAAHTLGASDRPLFTYTWVPKDGFTKEPPPGSCFDEGPAAAAMAEMYPNIEARLIGREGPGVYHGLDAMLLASESVARNGLNLALLAATGERARDDGVRVLLEGTNGNMTLSYSGGGLLHSLFKAGQWVRLFREIGHYPNPAHHWKRLLIHALPSSLVSALRRAKGSTFGVEDFISRRSVATRSAMARSAMFDAIDKAGFAFGTNLGKEESEQEMTFMERYAGPASANLLAAMPALYGFELRDPYFDRRLIEWRFGVPETQFRRDGRRRYLMERLLTGRVPDAIAQQSFGAGRQSADWRERMQPDLTRVRKDVETAADLSSLKGVLDTEKIIDLIDGLVADGGECAHGPEVDGSVSVPLAASVAAFALREAGSNR